MHIRGVACKSGSLHARQIHAAAGLRSWDDNEADTLAHATCWEEVIAWAGAERAG